ncbi:MAG: endopeptidase La [Oscillospiraceae bacterium]|jgi:ATP-dependent Lon protease|nr:endopeptidase La [Oscillospiraceae bacterium]
MELPLLALRGLVVFPGMVVSFDVGRKKSVLATLRAMEENQLIFLTAQKDLRDDDPGLDGLFSMGVVAQIRQVVKLPGDNIRLLAEGLTRAKVLEETADSPVQLVRVDECKIPDAGRNIAMQTALIRRTRELFAEYSSLSPKPSPDIIYEVIEGAQPGRIADYIAANLYFDFSDKQRLLSILHPVKRLKAVAELLTNECGVMKIEREIAQKVNGQITEHQREYYLSEQLKAISAELNGEDTPQEEAMQYREEIEALGFDKKIADKLISECSKLYRMPHGSQEGTVVRTYLDTVLELPWNKFSRDSRDLGRARGILERDHYGLEKIKTRIVEMLAVHARTGSVGAQILCLVGPPGVGKTSVARSIARCMNRKYARVSLGGVHDEAEIRGHRRTYLGSMPGRIISAIKQCGSANPLILLDEIDKMGSDYKGDPASALLEALDPEQNSTFRDHYLEIPFDLSKTLFITTANNRRAIPPPLLDRMEIVELTSYTREEKFQIARRHLISKQLKRHGLTAKKCKISDGAVYDLIDFYTREAGVRNLEREIAALCRKAVTRLADSETNGADLKQLSIGSKNLEALLGVRKFKPERVALRDETGVVNGLAWTSVGGEIMQLEAAVLPGTGKNVLTGSLGDVMKESAQAAISYIRAKADSLAIERDFYKTKDIHIHATEGAVPKDGPSAGIAMATAFVSALTGIPVRRDVAMTGEISLRGRVLPIGGLREKSMAAYRYGIKKVIIPGENLPDLAEVDAVVKENVEFVPVDHMDTVLKTALICEPPAAIPQASATATLPESVTVFPVASRPGQPLN